MLSAIPKAVFLETCSRDSSEDMRVLLRMLASSVRRSEGPAVATGAACAEVAAVTWGFARAHKRERHVGESNHVVSSKETGGFLELRLWSSDTGLLGRGVWLLVGVT